MRLWPFRWPRRRRKSTNPLLLRDPGGPANPDKKIYFKPQLADRWGHYPSAGLTPEFLANVLRYADLGNPRYQAELFEEMEEKDGHLSSLLQTRKLAVTALEWGVNPASDEESDHEVAEFVEKCLADLPDFQSSLRDLLDAIGKGYAAVEIIWAVKGGKAIPTDLAWIHPKRVTWANSVDPLIYDANNQPNPIPKNKVVFHTHRARSGIGPRAGVLRVCVWSYLFKNYSLKDWVAFNEVYGMPIRLGRYAAGATSEDRQALADALESMATDCYGVISKDTEIEIKEARSALAARNNPYQVLCDFCNSEMSKAILGQTLTTDTKGATGTYSAAKVHGEVRQDLVEADAEALCRTLVNQLIRPIVGFNFGWDRELPQLTLAAAEERDLESLSKVYEIIKEKLQYPLTMEHVSEIFGLPMPNDGDVLCDNTFYRGPEEKLEPLPLPEPAEGVTEGEVGEDAEEGGEAEEEAAKAAVLPLRKRGLAVDDGDLRAAKAIEDMDRLADEAIRLSGAAVARMLEPVMARIEKGESLEALRDGLFDAYPEMPSEELAELVYQAVMLAYMRARADEAAKG